MTALEEIKKAIEDIGPLKVEFTPDGDEYNSIIIPTVDGYDGTFFTVIGCGDKQDKLGALMAATVNAVPELLSTLESLQRENEALRANVTRTRKFSLDMGEACDLAEIDADHLRARAEAAEAEVKRLVESGQSFANQVRNIIYRLNGTEFSSTVYERDQFDANLRLARTALASTGGEHNGN
ncbi:hypothetical protein D3C80_612010 [compost metagenome]